MLKDRLANRIHTRNTFVMLCWWLFLILFPWMILIPRN